MHETVGVFKHSYIFSFIRHTHLTSLAIVAKYNVGIGEVLIWGQWDYTFVIDCSMWLDEPVNI